MRVGIVQCSSDEFLPQSMYSAPNKLEYCLKWGIEFHYCRIELNSGVSITNQRMFGIIDHLRRVDWLWFLGADTLIMNMTKDIKDIIDDDYEFIIAKDVNGINNDSCLYKNCPNTFKFLETILELNKKLPNDQVSMNHAFRATDIKVKFIDQNLFNSYLYCVDTAYDYCIRHLPKELVPRHFEDGDFVLHFPGMLNDHRLDLMKEYSPKVIR